MSSSRVQTKEEEDGYTMKSNLRSLVLAALVVVGPVGIAGAKEKVVVGELNWTAAIAIQNILKVVIEDRLGADVEFVRGDSASIFAGMDKGAGEFDVYTDLWMPNQAGAWAKHIAKGSRQTVRVNKQPYTGVQGLFIPGYVRDMHGVKSVNDLANPAIAKLFDTDGDGKGEFWPGGPGWGATDVEQVKAKTYGYDKYFEPVVVEQWVMETRLKAAYERKNPILFYYWTPEWIHAKFDLRRLEEPDFTGYSMDSKRDDPLYDPKGCWHMIGFADDPQWLEKSHIDCAWPDAQVYVAYSKSLTKRVPNVAKFLDQIVFEPATINDWILKISVDKMAPEKMAKDWVKNNPDTVSAWLKGT